MKRIYRHNQWHFELVAVVKAEEVDAEIARRQAADEKARQAGWHNVQFTYRVGN